MTRGIMNGGGGGNSGLLHLVTSSPDIADLVRLGHIANGLALIWSIKIY